MKAYISQLIKYILFPKKWIVSQSKNQIIGHNSTAYKPQQASSFKISIINNVSILK